jgi:CRISPR system Cascade subunit CasD
MCVTVALRLDPAEGEPTLNYLAEALEEPARPLFIGRKPCLPSGRLFAGFSDGETSLAALLAAPMAGESHDGPGPIRLLWPENESPAGMTDVRVNRRSMLTDERNWVSGLHGGGRSVCEGSAPRSIFSTKQPDQDGQ